MLFSWQTHKQTDIVKTLRSPSCVYGSVDQHSGSAGGGGNLRQVVHIPCMLCSGYDSLGPLEAAATLGKLSTYHAVLCVSAVIQWVHWRRRQP